MIVTHGRESTPPDPGAYPSLMSLIFATQLTAVATAILAVFAILTGIYAIRAFRKQSKETSDQAIMLKVQSDRLEVYRTQVDEQREINDTRGKVLELQAREIRASLEQRERAADEERRSQAVRVTAWFTEDPHGLWERASATTPICPSSMSGRSSTTSLRSGRAETGNPSRAAAP